ncbi:MAG: hypothetical protein ACSW8D_02585 [Prevotella sp.]|jgi:hypothetical protein
MNITMILTILLTGIGALLCIVISRLYDTNQREERKLADITRRLTRAMAIHSTLMFL